ncbi:hypothetical protein QE382_004126 [Sphingobacterium zeae]|uniref:Uncharacterized protein n=1 Tax=Sphingobacterium zeae TaxID=1776859 RepID=A0ABU0UBA0_9SPHI|nr:hypothetical protein [Sphingobacterium zeae]
MNNSDFKPVKSSTVQVILSLSFTAFSNITHIQLVFQETQNTKKLKIAHRLTLFISF